MLELVERFINSLKLPLPGERAHELFAPPGRSVSQIELLNQKDYQEAAVAVVICLYLKTPSILLIQRTPYDGVHGGQIGFPGGKKETSDLSSEATARRETFEEIGLDLLPNSSIGKLSEIFIPVSSFRVDPYVFIIDSEPSFTLNPREVEGIIMLPIDALFSNKTIQTRTICRPNGTDIIDVPAFVYNDYVVWGATALILGELRMMVLEHP